MKTLPVSYAMLAVATMHFIIGWVRGIRAFSDSTEGSALAYYADISNPLSLLRTSCLCLQATMGDAIVIWRLYIVYGRRLKVIIPAIILVVAYVAIGVSIIAIIKTHPSTDIYHMETPLVTAYFSLTMTTNLILSGAIAMRIFLAGEPLHHSSRPHWLIIFTLIESCALYTFTVLAALVTFLCGSFAQYPAVDSIVPIVGICFSLIVLQIRFHVSATHGPRFGSDLHATSAVWPRPHARPFDGRELEEPKSPMQPIRMAIHVSKHTDTDLHPHDDTGHSSLEVDDPLNLKPTLA
jgi:hypothetical protein